MQNPNPISYSDLISPDNSINELIGQLNNLIAKYEELKTKISGNAAELAKSLKDISGATESQREAIAGLTAESEKLAKDYEKITNQQAKAEKEVKKLTQAEKEKAKVDKLLEQYNKSAEGSFNRLSAKYRLNKIELNAMSEAERHGTEAGRELERQTRAIYEQMSNLQKATGKYTLEVGHYENALRGLHGPLGMVVNRFTQFGTQIRGIASSDLPLGKKALLGLAAGFTAVGAAAVIFFRALSGGIKVNKDFEQNVANLSTILGVSRDSMSALTNSALALGRTTEYTASQVLELQTALAKLGFNQAQIMGMQKSILQFATAVGANLGEAAEVAGATLRSFNLTSADTDEVLATLAVATNNSALSFSRIRESIGTVFPVANAFGISVKDTVALLGALANAGFDASSAATATRNILLKMADANGDLAKSLGGSVRTFDGMIEGMRRLHNQGVDLTKVLELTDKRSVAAFNSLLSGVDSTEKLRESLENVDGELERIQKERLDTLEGSTLLLKSAWEGLTLAFQSSNGVMKDTVDWLTKLIGKVQELLFPEEAAQQKFLDYYNEMFTEILQKSPELAEEIINNTISGLEKRRADAWKKYYDTSSLNVIGQQQRLKQAEELSNQEKAAKKAAKQVTDLAKAQAKERADAAKSAADAAAKAQEELSEKEKKEREKRAKQAAQQRIKDRQSAVDSINFEIAATTAGTEAMLDARLRKIDAERELELERNRQRAETERKDEETINAKYDADRIKAVIQFNKEVAQLNVQRLQAEQQGIQLQLSNAKKGTERELALRLKANEKQMEIEIEQNKTKDERIRQSESAIRTKYYRQVMQLVADFNVKIAQRDLKATQDIAASEFSMLEKNERQKTEFRLDQERYRLTEVLRINEMATDKMTDLEVEAVKKAIQAIDAEKKRLGFDNIYELLGISLSSEQQSAINTALDSVKDSIGSLIDMWKQAADAARETADAQVEAAQKMLEAEMEARRQGYASREEYARKELALARSQQEAAIAEQRKAQQAQESIDTLTQASSLVTASANIWKALSGIPEIGPFLAIAAITTMWGSFAAAKVKAAEMTKSIKYGEGTVELLQGGSHASGHDIDLGTRKDGTRRRAEGGEYFAVINKRNSAKYGALIPEVINSLNNGTFAERFARAGDEMAGAVLAMSGRTDVSGLERDVRAIRQQGTESRSIENGWMVIRKGNYTRKIKS